MTVELRDYQLDALDALRRSIGSGHRSPMLQAPTGSGKCLGIGTLVMRFDGSLIPVESLKTGDRLMGPDSRPRIILSTCRGVGPLYRIDPVKGKPWVCNDVHVLTLVETESGKVIDLALDEYLRRSKWFKHIHKLFQPETGVDFLPRPDPIIPGYFLGIWVGDGTKALKGVQVSKPDKEILEECERIACTWGLSVRTRLSYNGCPTHSIVQEGKGRNGNGLLTEMRKLMGDGAIPHSLLTSSREFRRDFLAGVIDTDGHVRNGYAEVVQKNKAYSDGIGFVARSLGFRVCFSEKIVDGTIYHRMSICGDLSALPMRIARKQSDPRLQKKRVARTGFSVQAIGNGEYAGFELDGDGRFLLGDFTVTHNTKLSAAIIESARAKSKRIAFTVPALSLIDQTVQMFWDEGIRDVGVIQADHVLTDWSKPVQICSVDTLARQGFPQTDIVIVDEAHRVSQTITKWMSETKIPFIGLSATPWARGLGRLYDDLIVVTTTKQLIDQGYLSPFKVFAPAHPDLSQVKIVAGDYHEGQLSDTMSKPEIIADVVKTWLSLGEGRPTICFAVDRAHARLLQDQFTDAGVPAAYQDANTTLGEREIIRKQFHDSRVKVVCSVGTMIVGIDWDVRCIIWARPTKSEILYTQGTGRGLRTADGKATCLILDHADNALRLGLVTDIHHDTLDGHKHSQSKPNKTPLPKECPQCSCLRPPRASECPNCGFVVVAQPNVLQVDGELAEFKRDGGSCKVSKARKTVSIAGTEIPLAQFYGALKAYGKAKGWKEGWASNKYRTAVGVWPNAYRDVAECAMPDCVKSWIKSRNIAYAKRRDALPKTPPAHDRGEEDRQIEAHIAQHGVTKISVDEEIMRVLRGEA